MAFLLRNLRTQLPVFSGFRSVLCTNPASVPLSIQFGRALHSVPSNLPSLCELNANGSPQLMLVRTSTVFTSVPAGQLWEGVTGPKGGSKKRSRGKRRVLRQKTDLHRGQRLGMGKAGIVYPGLNAPVIGRTGILTIKSGQVNEEYFKRLDQLRFKAAVKKKRAKLPPLLRGWSGTKFGGQSIGPPSPQYPEFDCRILEMKVVSTMTATVGRYRRFSVLVVTGNGRGLCGIGKSKSVSFRAAVRRAKTRATQNIISFELRDNRTLWHVGHVKEWHTSIFAKPLPDGSGLTCHRLLRTICQVIGIKDMYAKVEGNSKNYLIITRGFLRLLSEQQTYSDLANKTGMHVVQFSTDEDMYPRVLASPAPGCSVYQNATKTNETETHPLAVPAKDKELPILAISHPVRSRPRRPKPERYESLLDDLVDIGEGSAVETDMAELIASGERDVDTLALGGRVAMIRGKARPGYWNNPGNLKMAAIRHRYRNREAAERQREVFEALDRDHQQQQRI